MVLETFRSQPYVFTRLQPRGLARPIDVVQEKHTTTVIEIVGARRPVQGRLRFQYKYPGTPINTMVVPQKASVGRVRIVFRVHAAPINT